MKSPSPDALKLVKDYSRPVITFAIARPDGSDSAYIGCSDFKVYAADFAAAKFEPKELYSHESYVTGVALVGNTLVSCSYDGKLTWFDTEEKKTIRSHEAHAKWIRKVIASPDGKLIASVADDMVCKLWEIKTGKLVHELRGHKEKTPNDFNSMLYAVAFSADSKLLATGDKVGHIVVWDTKSGKPLSTCEAPVMYTWDKVQRNHSIGGIRSLAFSPDGKSLAVGGMGKVGNIDHLEGKARVEVFDWKSSKQIVEFPGDKFVGLVNRLAWAPDGSWLVGAGGAGEGFFLFYDVTNKKTLRQEKVMTHVHDFAITAAADLITCVGHSKIVVYRLN